MKPPSRAAILTLLAALAPACTAAHARPDPGPASGSPEPVAVVAAAASPTAPSPAPIVAASPPPTQGICIDEVRVQAEIGSGATVDGGTASAGSPDSLRAGYRRARAYYDANSLEAAALLFRGVALDPAAVSEPEGLGEFASDLYLDSLNVMGSQWSPRRPACIARMAEDVPRIRVAYCSGRVAARREEFCSRICALSSQIARHQAELLHSEGRFREAGAQYLALAEPGECAQGARLRFDEMLHNAAIEFDAAGAPDDARRAREALVRRFLASGSPLAREAQRRLTGGP